MEKPNHQSEIPNIESDYSRSYEVIIENKSEYQSERINKKQG